MIKIEVAYAELDKQVIKALEVAEGTTALQAVEASGITDEFDTLDQGQEFELGVFSKKCVADEVLRAGDRVEIYRPLLIDPKEARRLKAEVAERRKAQES